MASTVKPAPVQQQGGAQTPTPRQGQSGTPVPQQGAQTIFKDCASI